MATELHQSVWTWDLDFLRCHENQLANSFEASLRMALLTWRERVMAVRARKRELYPKRSAVWDSQGVVWYQPSRLNWVIPAIMTSPLVIT